MKCVYLIGEGARGAPVERLYEHGIPILTSWPASDIVDNDTPMYMGRPGVYGQRCANKVLYNADLVIAIGCRLSVWTVGHTGLRPEQKLVMVDVDKAELDRFPNAEKYQTTATAWINENRLFVNDEDWITQCQAWKLAFPWFDPSHKSIKGKINAYEVCAEIEKLESRPPIIVSDMGVAIAGLFQAMKVRKGERFLTSQGLGEMGVALPAAIGASFATNKGPVLCLHCDGGMMMNLQELATIVHHRLPIKIIVFDNGGYAMIKSTSRNMRMKYSGVDGKAISLPDFCDVALAFGLHALEYRGFGNVGISLGTLMATPGPSLLVIETDPEQDFSPKLQPIVKDGQIRSPTFEELSP